MRLVVGGRTIGVAWFPCRAYGVFVSWQRCLKVTWLNWRASSARRSADSNRAAMQRWRRFANWLTRSVARLAI